MVHYKVPAAVRNYTVLLGNCRVEGDLRVEDDSQDAGISVMSADNILSAQLAVIVRALDDDNHIASFVEITKSNPNVHESYGPLDRFRSISIS